MPTLRPHKFIDGTKTYYVKLPDVYDNASHTIGNAFGLKLVTADTASEDEDGDGITVSEGLLTGKLIRVRLSYIVGTGLTAKRRTARVVCPIGVASKAIVKVLSEKYKGIEISSAGIPRRRRLG
ncbi:MAG: hypothetical protein HC764_23940 [Pleurocapsa sp. CRU_1_2]|nr:hypothetical protein [Pleurocapsa sp. CRU_1_2]